MTINKRKHTGANCTAKSVCPTTNEVNGWNLQEIRKFLESKNIKLEDIIIIIEQEVDGSSFLKLTAADLERWGILGGPAIKIESLIKEIQGSNSNNSLHTAKGTRPTEDPKNIIDEEIRDKWPDFWLPWFHSLYFFFTYGFRHVGGKRPLTGDIFLLFDHSNLLEQGKETVKRCENLVDKPILYIEYEQLRKTIAKGRNLGDLAVIYCSRFSQSHDKRMDNLWNKRIEQGFAVNLIKQRPNSTREKKVDTSLIVQGMKILYTKEPGTLIIIAGDGDYIPLVQSALDKGWKVEIWFWGSGLSGEYKPELSNTFGTNYSLHVLDDEYKKVTYARGPESPRKFTFEIKHEYVENLKDDDLLKIFVDIDLFGWWHWINNNTLKVYVNTEKQEEEVRKKLKIFEETMNLNQN
ncbi:6768_t:CDS:2 [Funneliformis mosseae]|uniref:6768_t:CDS:1 n=1 Tax=Funneliformis mosseae TaxID=27381 RepID=A0A9N9F4R4_FUNMO|nr:6768_t:CDS:2 [Funneliformis mosseae]